MKKIFKYKLVILFCLIVISVTVADVLNEEKTFSALENRVLAKLPEFSKESLLENEFTMQYEEFIDDQFVGRDSWIDLKSRSETLLGKIENNGIVYGQKNYMFEKYPSTNEERINSNVDHIKDFIKNYNSNVSVGIIPSSYMKNQLNLPIGLNNVDQYSYIEDINREISATRNVNGNSADVFSMIETPIEYYRTDHHWTAVGAHRAYAELMEQWDRPYIPLDRGILGDDETTGTFGLVDVGEFYGTYYRKSKAYNTVPDHLGYYDIPTTEVTVDGETVNGLYDYGRLLTGDKYGMFLHGNNGVTVIQSDNHAALIKEKEAPITFTTTGGAIESFDTEIENPESENPQPETEAAETEEISRVLLIKDSYGNCFAPFLTYSFDEVVVVDLRSMSKPMSDFIKEKKYDEVIILYGFMNLAEDTNLAKISQ